MNIIDELKDETFNYHKEHDITNFENSSLYFELQSTHVVI